MRSIHETLQKVRILLDFLRLMEIEVDRGISGLLRKRPDNITGLNLLTVPLNPTREYLSLTRHRLRRIVKLKFQCVSNSLLFGPMCGIFRRLSGP